MPTFMVFKKGYGSDDGPIGINLDDVQAYLPASNEVMNKKGVGFHDGVKIFFKSDDPNELNSSVILDISFEKFCKVVGAVSSDEEN